MKPTPFIVTVLLLVFSIFPAEARIKGPFVSAEIYGESGVTVAADSVRIRIPKKHEAVVPVSGAYTKNQKKEEPIAAGRTDSVVVWVPTSPEFRHTLIYYEPYGWCWQLEKNSYIALYAYCGNGYRLWGNGGMSPCGKYILIAVKNGIATEFKKTHKRADDKFRRRVAALVADDPVLGSMILESRTRRDKTLRMLGLYNPVY